MLLYWILLPIVWVLAHILWRFEVIGRENLKTVRDGRAYVIAPVYLFVNFHLFYQFVFMIALLMFLSISLFSREVF